MTNSLILPRVPRVPEIFDGRGHVLSRDVSPMCPRATPYFTACPACPRCVPDAQVPDRVPVSPPL